MKNLTLKGCQGHLLQSGDVKGITVDSSIDAVFVAVGLSENNPGLTIYKIAQGKEPREFITYDDPRLLSENQEPILIRDMKFLSESSSICIVLSNGEILMIRTEVSPDEDVVESIGDVENGILAAQWSPDEQVFALVTGNSTILLMSKNFDTIAEVDMLEKDLTEFNKHVSVGWGRAETQFRGKRVRAKLRDPTLPEKVDEGKLSPYDSSEVTLSWRGDGAYVSVNRIENGVRRAIRVYNREGALDSISEPVDFMEGQVGWRPSGALIAAVQRGEDDRKTQVIFFERNGLRHGEFTLRDVEDQPVSDVSWNISSDVLAVCYSSMVQFWTRSNYYWYLKQEFRFDSNIKFQWHPEKAYTCYIYSKDKVEILDFENVYSNDTCLPPNDLGVMPVIDGNVLKITPLSLVNIPPPMSLHEYELPFNCRSVSVSSNSDCIFAMGPDQLHRLFVDNWDITSAGNWDIASYAPGLIFKSVVCLSSTEVLLLADDADTTTVIFFNVKDDDLVMQDVHQYEKRIIKATTAVKENVFYLQTIGGDILRYDLATCEMKDVGVKFPAECYSFQACMANEIPVFIGLSRAGRLYADTRLLAQGCTSFLCVGNMLAFTTNKHILKFVCLKGYVDDFFVVDDSAIKDHDERCRNVERGSELVTLLPSKMSIVLQMPRGNLETIHPRLMVLNGVRDNIVKLDYGKAFIISRTHRIDLNLLFDYDPEKFFSNITLFVEQVKRTDYLDLFLSSLKSEDVTKTMYADTFSSRGSSATTCEDKVNKVCEAIRRTLQTSFSKTHLQTVLTSYLCQQPPDVTAALSIVSDLKVENEGKAEEAIKHISFLTDINMLFDFALGTYDLKLALMIAQQSQKDPREYIPFLRAFQKETPLRRKYNIDCHLKRFESALQNLSEIENAFDEVKNFVVSHKLYSEALKLYRYKKEQRKELLLLYANYLKDNGKAKEAAIAFESVGEYDRAIDAFKSAGAWRECLSIMESQSYPKHKIEEAATDLLALCLEKREYNDAGYLNVFYLRNKTEAIQNFCKGTMYAEAIRIAHGSNENLYEAVLLSSLNESFVEASETIADYKGQVKAQTERLQVLRTKKQENPAAWYEGIVDDGTPDDISLASTSMTSNPSLYTRYTGTSQSSRMTRNTARNRKRMERKRARGKKGTIFEEEYLVNSLRRLITRVNETRDEQQRLIEALMRCDMFAQANEIQHGFSQVIDTLREKATFIFSDPVKPVSSNEGLPEQSKSENLPIPQISPFEKFGILA
ncbi:elongator subunit Iki3 [Schizosaccharomyces japonicus yFS275]|uniref:Elongator complex protein 1 n=1 Tax=Schizosaccharomyces japonicus (strain yFS275 / FY16936) TaxID=402676 RepID=B6JW12_SCHJY|nr:elongator subunit Iki3 [Schizosaccharomyces japonicus yFS275]EEB05563.1 elongator subunit Iki3 [Schizosaccharomyces japonicus yFS275]